MSKSLYSDALGFAQKQGDEDMKKTFFAALAVAICASSNANLITNGSFEDGTFVGDSNKVMSASVGSNTLNGWTVFAGSVAWIENQNPSPWYVASDGMRCVDLTDSRDAVPYGGVKQDVPTVVGQTYLVTFDLGIHSRYSTSICCVQLAAADAQQVFTAEAVSGKQTWYHNSLTFKANASTTSIQFLGLLATPADIGLDNVSMVAVPEPMTWAALAGGIALLRRKKRR
jgi:hypothetical protein